MCIQMPSLQPKRIARLAQSVERKALNLVVVGSSPTVGGFCYLRFMKMFHAGLEPATFGS